jgi:hypothetical protein
MHLYQIIPRLAKQNSTMQKNSPVLIKNWKKGEKRKKSCIEVNI